MAITIRIDEFSAPSEIDGALSLEEQVRFLTFGFDIAFAEPQIVVTPKDRIFYVMKENRTDGVNKENRLLSVLKENRIITA